jgi:hypothetical protein
MNTKCPNCGIVHNVKVCPNCGTLSTPDMKNCKY